ncbi:hypothetical protein CLV84_2967 [Neolewinella xylanilytica]|uniref:Uncharacterized protein n=1 Tax=Neolewinella xylanilytica TaxID=1514080 RepID=A0A2S6I4F4_9BACT|nr:hypothetical protein [Neolewinella xylanilytica]PPK86050.1 hypothetical protein CLV84_2967 [Neolewinella xylanilytica]
MEQLDPIAFAHFTYHRSILLESGIKVELWFAAAKSIELTIQQVDAQPFTIPHAELKDRATAIFRFLPYAPAITVLERIQIPVSTYRICWTVYPYFPSET